MQIRAYLFEEHCDVENWLDGFALRDRWQREAWQDQQITYYDTFDWRLYDNGVTLELTEVDGNGELALHSVHGELLATSSGAAPPGLVQDLPADQLRQHLKPLLKMRRLLPQVTLRSRREHLALLNSDDKTVLRLTVSIEPLAISPQYTQHPLRPGLQLFPVKGYPLPAERIVQALDEDPALQAATQHPLADGLAAFGRHPGDYSSKLTLDLSPELTAQQALRSLLRHLLAVVQANIDGTCKDLDSEFLHDLRVSVGRTRLTQNQLKGLLPAEQLAPFREGFSWLGTITGPTRDLDVYLLKFADYSQRLPTEHQGDLVPFQRFLQQRQSEEQQKLAAFLQGPRCCELLRDWQAFLEQEREPDPALPHAERPVKEVAARRIRKLFRRCLREGQAITADSPATELHELRKTCKKLRYLLEFFQSLYPPEDLATLIKALKGLQDNLGDFNDFQVQSEAMLTFGLQMAKMKKGPPATLLAMGMLAENLRQQQGQTLQEFEQRFASFSAKHNCQLFRQLFGKTDGKGAPRT